MNSLKNQPVTRWPTYFFSGYWDTCEKFQKSVKSYIKLPFLANLIAFLDSLGQKTYMGEFSGLYHVPVRKYSRKRCQENVAQVTHRATFSRTKNALNQNPLGVECWNFQDFLVCTVPIYITTTQDLWRWVTSPGWLPPWDFQGNDIINIQPL